MDRNFINIDISKRDAPIFRIVSIERLFQIFDERKVTLVRPSMWDDPFENYIMNATGELEDGQPFSVAFREHFYGQCWTFTRESDALWRIYSPEKNGVRISSTPRKLLKCLYNFAGEFRQISSFIGKVEYYTTQGLIEYLGDSDRIHSHIFDSTGLGQASSLLFKRIPFKHENEVRIIYNSFGKTSGNIFKFDIDPFTLIDDIVFDPRMKYADFKGYKTALEEIGYKGRIVKSNLYSIPKLKFKV